MKILAILIFLTYLTTFALCKAAKRGDRLITEGAKEDEKTV